MLTDLNHKYNLLKLQPRLEIVNFQFYATEQWRILLKVCFINADKPLLNVIEVFEQHEQLASEKVTTELKFLSFGLSPFAVIHCWDKQDIPTQTCAIGGVKLAVLGHLNKTSDVWEHRSHSVYIFQGNQLTNGLLKAVSAY